MAAASAILPVTLQPSVFSPENKAKEDFRIYVSEQTTNCAPSVIFYSTFFRISRFLNYRERLINSKESHLHNFILCQFIHTKKE